LAVSFGREGFGEGEGVGYLAAVAGALVFFWGHDGSFLELFHGLSLMVGFVVESVIDLVAWGDDMGES